jgi:hypothetical protein
MALIADKMKEAVIDALSSGSNTANDANKNLGDAVLKYICNNIGITYAWNATNPATGAPDPIVVFDATVSGRGTLTPSTNVDEMMIKLATLIKGLTIAAPTGFVLSPLTFNPAGAIVVVMSGEDTQDAAIGTLCTGIVTAVKMLFKNPAPASGAHNVVYVGATAGMVIV